VRILVLGGGLQGSACALDLLRNSEAAVTLADARVETLAPSLRSEKGKRLQTVKLDARDHTAVLELMASHDAAASALPYYFNYDMARLAVEAGIHYADLGGNTEIVRQQEGLSEAVEGKKISVMPDCGLAPGLVNILAAEGIRRMDTVESVKLYVGGLPQEPQPPLNYHIVYSLEGVLDYYTTPSWIIRDGKPVEVEALSELELVDFPQPAGSLEAFHTAGGISTMPWTFQDRVPVMEYKTLRYPGHVEIMRAIRDLGLIDTDPVVVEAGEVRPRDLFVAVVGPKLRNPEARDLVALKVIVRGAKADRPKQVAFELLDLYDEELGISAMMRTTGFSLAITSLMQVGARVTRYGVAPAYEGMPFEPYVMALAKRGINISESD